MTATEARSPEKPYTVETLAAQDSHHDAFHCGPCVLAEEASRSRYKAVASQVQNSGFGYTVEQSAEALAIRSGRYELALNPIADIGAMNYL